MKEQDNDGLGSSSRGVTGVSTPPGHQVTRAVIASLSRQDFFGARWRGAAALLGLLLVLLGYMAITTSIKLLPASRFLNSFQSGRTSETGTRNQPH